MSDNNEDVIASVMGSQDGQLDTEVGQDEGTSNEESSTEDWEAQAKYHQSEKDKLYAENQQMKATVQKFLDSRETEQPKAPEKIALKPDEFDPWEGLNGQQMESFFEFADKHPSEYGLDNVLKMWQAVSQPAQGGERENPLDKVRQTQSSPQAAGVLQGQQPKRKSEDESMWEGVLNSTRVGNRIP